MLVEGYPAKPRCINTVGLKRNNFPPHVIESLTEAYRLLYRTKVGLDNAWEILRNNGQLVPQVNHLLSFVQGQHEGLHGRGRERRRAGVVVGWRRAQRRPTGNRENAGGSSLRSTAPYIA